MITLVSVNVLRASLKRNGVWLVDLNGNATEFYHKACWEIKHGR